MYEDFSNYPPRESNIYSLGSREESSIQPRWILPQPQTPGTRTEAGPGTRFTGTNRLLARGMSIFYDAHALTRGKRTSTRDREPETEKHRACPRATKARAPLADSPVASSARVASGKLAPGKGGGKSARGGDGYFHETGAHETSRGMVGRGEKDSRTAVFRGYEEYSRATARETSLRCLYSRRRITHARTAPRHGARSTTI